MALCELTAGDADAVRQFFLELSAEDRTFFWDDLTDPSVVARWVADERRSPMCVLEDDRIAAFAALAPQTEWSSHVAELVLVVGRHSRRRGYGRTLAQAMLLGALRRDFIKVTVSVAADRPGAIAMFQGIGFQAEALLRDHLRDPESGLMRDLVILSHLVEETYPHLLAAGLDRAAE
jgi:L-amino acid N-acyltransferase YncA